MHVFEINFNIFQYNKYSVFTTIHSFKQDCEFIFRIHILNC